MSLDDVPAHAAVGAQRQFEVDESAFGDPRERCAHPGFRSEIRAETVRCDVESGQAHAADGDTIAGLQFLRDALGFDSEAAVFAALLDLCDTAYFFDDSGKHKLGCQFSVLGSRLK